MQNEKNAQNNETGNPEGNEGTPLKSSTDRKNEDVKNDTPSATERVRPNSGDGLANEGTNVSYTEER